MNDNRMKWPLLILCLGVWGAVFHSFFGKGGETITQPVKREVSVTVPKKESYSLSLSYSDPFLGKGVARKRKVMSSSPIVPTSSPSVSRSILESRANTKPKKKKKVVFPQIVYKGYVKQLSGTGGSASVDFDGKPMHWKKGEKKDDIHLLEIYTDSICIMKDGVRKTIKR